MLLKLALISCLSTVFASCPTPASIEKTIRVQECRTGRPIFCVLNLTVTNSDGIQKYPVNIRKPFTVHIVVANNGNTVNNMLSDGDIQTYMNLLWFPCSWRSLPTFGLLNMKACVGCPLLPGINKITMLVAFFASLTKEILQAAYAVEVVARDGNHPETELACIRIEGVIEN
ncbi:hypothetical protein TTRE_0000225201 [Trichuris trichiura]|uniref:MD-2-related lipid-recognition domain-containing protein n=1 Tax=Trichuris trichiura TaxID=36087 RepID=A0A077Z2P1_TRITR|nr:hypothetical protein TTRE_0000225201 [Trichuris trichiura]